MPTAHHSKFTTPAEPSTSSSDSSPAGLLEILSESFVFREILKRKFNAPPQPNSAINSLQLSRTPLLPQTQSEFEDNSLALARVRLPQLQSGLKAPNILARRVRHAPTCVPSNPSIESAEDKSETAGCPGIQKQIFREIRRRKKRGMATTRDTRMHCDLFDQDSGNSEYQKAAEHAAMHSQMPEEPRIFESGQSNDDDRLPGHNNDTRPAMDGSETMVPPPHFSNHKAPASEVHEQGSRASTSELSAYVESLEAEVTFLQTRLEILQLPSPSSSQLERLDTVVGQSQVLSDVADTWHTRSGERAESTMHGSMISTKDLHHKIRELEDKMHAREERCLFLEEQIKESERRLRQAEEGERAMSRRVDMFGAIMAGGPSRLVSEPGDGRAWATAPTTPILADVGNLGKPQSRSRSVLTSMTRPALSIPSIRSVSPHRKRLSINMDDITSWHQGIGVAEVIPEDSVEVKTEDAATEIGSASISDQQSAVTSNTQLTSVDVAEPHATISSRPISLMSNSSFSASWGLPVSSTSASTEAVNASRVSHVKPLHQPRRMRRFQSASGGLKPLILPNATNCSIEPSLTSPQRQTSLHSRLGSLSDASFLVSPSSPYPLPTNLVDSDLTGRGPSVMEGALHSPKRMCIPSRGNICMGSSGCWSADAISTPRYQDVRLDQDSEYSRSQRRDPFARSSYASSSGGQTLREGNDETMTCSDRQIIDEMSDSSWSTKSDRLSDQDRHLSQAFTETLFNVVGEGIAVWTSPAEGANAAPPQSSVISSETLRASFHQEVESSTVKQPLSWSDHTIRSSVAHEVPGADSALPLRASVPLLYRTSETDPPQDTNSIISRLKDLVKSALPRRIVQHKALNTFNDGAFPEPLTSVKAVLTRSVARANDLLGPVSPFRFGGIGWWLFGILHKKRTHKVNPCTLANQSLPNRQLHNGDDLDIRMAQIAAVEEAGDIGLFGRRTTGGDGERQRMLTLDGPGECLMVRAEPRCQHVDEQIAPVRLGIPSAMPIFTLTEAHHFSPSKVSSHPRHVHHKRAVDNAEKAIEYLLGRDKNACPSCIEPFLRRKLRVWSKIILTLVLTIGVSLLDGPR